jgi:predicted nucleic acid-binding protein
VLLVDTNVLVDVIDRDSEWFDWSIRQLRHQSQVHELAINPVIYAEFAPSFETQHRLDARVEDMELAFRELPRSALYVAGLAHRQYRTEGGPRHTILADFFIGAHAMVLGCGILTRDVRRYRRYFPRVPLVTPEAQ